MGEVLQQYFHSVVTQLHTQNNTTPIYDYFSDDLIKLNALYNDFFAHPTTYFQYIPRFSIFEKETQFSYNQYIYLNLFKNSLYYTNTFLILYLVLLFILVNLLFKLTAAPFHF